VSPRRAKAYRRFPGDDEFRRDLHTRDLYNFRSRSYWLRRLENHGRQERVAVDENTIEHILPQNPNLSTAAWRRSIALQLAPQLRPWLLSSGRA
jgi:hypothetical protein